MKWTAVLMEFRDDRGVLSPQHSQETIDIPIEYLPKGCRIGDVLQFNISFDPFSTLAMLNESQIKNE